MLEGLFDEEAASFDAKQKAGGSKSSRLPRPAAPRNSTGLCGLSNLGATCYLNSLLQTLHFTPEFRESLFSLEDGEMGLHHLEQKTEETAPLTNQHMVREIPVELQKLFARLLLLNQQSSEVNALTTSFGWKSNEEFQQHDVQELNRILFGAIESSLLGTSGERLIANLYHGSSVQQIICQRCGKVSEREEEFQDIPVALSGQSGLQDSLKDMFIETETLEGANQYRCSNCDQLVDAKRECHLRKLPSVLTFALLRFLYDFDKGERYKDTSKFKFPMKLDMTPYCEANTGSVRGRQEYELFSVVIHSGSTHSGHYTAIIRDVDQLGTWTHPSDEPVQLPSDPSSGKTDLIEYENPADLIKALLVQLGGAASLNKICKTLQEQTGVTWNKRFKKQFGPINKFLKSCSDLFAYNEMKQVSLLTNTPPSKTADISTIGENTPSVNLVSSSSAPADSTPITSGDNPCNQRTNESTDQLSVSHDSVDTAELESSYDKDLSEVGGEGVCEGEGRREGGEAKGGGDEEEKTKDKRKPPPSPATKKSAPPPPGHCWFEFNDTHVSPTVEEAIDKMFQGKQSAYMLFYRRAAMTRPLEARGNPLYGVPERLQVEVAAANAKLEEERHQYDIAINTVKLNIHHSSNYFFANGALQSLPGTDSTVLTIDRRKTIAELKVAIYEAVSSDVVVIHTARALPAGLHLYDCVSHDDDLSIIDVGITNDTSLFVWDGVQVAGDAIQVGPSCEPVLLHVTYHTPSSSSSRAAGEGSEYELVSGFPKNSTLKELRTALCGVLGVEPGSRVTISQVKMAEGRGRAESAVIILGINKDKLTLDELKFSDGERLAAEKEVRKGVKTLAHSVADKRNKLLSLIIEDHCSPLADVGSAYQLLPVEVAKDELLSSLKMLVLSRMGIENQDGCRLRTSDDLAGIGPPLYEDQTLLEAGLTQGMKLIIEPGPVPLKTQLALQCVVSSDIPGVSTGEVVDVILDRNITISECCVAMVMSTGLTGEEWHLRKTNWCGEAAEILDDESATVEQEKLKSGDLLLIEEGKLPPKGYIQLSAFLYTPGSASAGGSKQTGSSTVAAQGDSKSDEVPLHLVSPSLFHPPMAGDLLELGKLLVCRESTVEDLKLMILTLPALEGACVPAPSFLRLRELVDGRPAKILKQSGNTLRRHKLTSDSKICCSILTQEEALPNTAVVFNVEMRVPGERRYEPLTEVVFDTASSTSPHSLRTHIANLIDLPVERISLAKHKLETFEWIRIQDSYESNSKGGGKKKGRGGGKKKVNIRNSPIMLKDGDTIGVKDLQYDPDDKDDFSTPEDDKGKAVLAAVQEEKRKKRKARGDGDILSRGGSGIGNKQRRPEVGIKIFVPDYRSHLQS